MRFIFITHCTGIKALFFWPNYFHIILFWVIYQHMHTLNPTIYIYSVLVKQFWIHRWIYNFISTYILYDSFHFALGEFTRKAVSYYTPDWDEKCELRSFVYKILQTFRSWCLKMNEIGRHENRDKNQQYSVLSVFTRFFWWMNIISCSLALSIIIWERNTLNCLYSFLSHAKFQSWSIIH